MLTGRDIVIKCVAEGRDPRTATAGEFGQGKPVTVGADDSIEEAIGTMQEHQVRRLPVIDSHNLIGMLSQADIARNYPEDRVGELVEFAQHPEILDARSLARQDNEFPCSTRFRISRRGAPGHLVGRWDEKAGSGRDPSFKRAAAVAAQPFFTGATPLKGRAQMTAENMEPVEISTRFRPGEWTEASLAALTASYQEKIRAMGAASGDIATRIDRGTNGSVAVCVSWDPGAGQVGPVGDASDIPADRTSVPGSPDVARGSGEDLAPGEITEDAKGLGAVLGDADRSAIDEPPGNPGPNALIRRGRGISDVHTGDG